MPLSFYNPFPLFHLKRSDGTTSPLLSRAATALFRVVPSLFFSLSYENEYWASLEKLFSIEVAPRLFSIPEKAWYSFFLVKDFFEVNDSPLFLILALAPPLEMLDPPRA